MIRLILVLSLILVPICASGSQDVIAKKKVTAAPTCADSSCTGFLTCQNFEAAATGWDNGESWTTQNNGTVDPVDTTASVLRGTQQVKILGSSTAASYIKKTFTSSTEVWAHLRLKFSDATPSTNNITVYLGDYTSLTLTTAGALSLKNGAQSLTTSNGVVSDNTKIHVWIHSTKGTGSNGIYQLYVSANGTRPASPTLDGSNGTNTANIAYIQVQSVRNYTAVFADQILVSTLEIGDVCD